MWTPNLGCLTVHPETKVMSNGFGSGSNFSSGFLRWFGSFLVFRPSGFGAIY
jgi:hypothetical protein